MRTLVVLLSSLTLLAPVAGCKADKKPPPAQPGSGSAGSAAATDPAAGSGSVQQEKGQDIALPKSPSTPPNKTTQQLGAAEFAKLAELAWPGFDKIVRDKDKTFDVRHTTTRPRLATTVTIAPCFDCTPMVLDAWKAKESSLKVLLAPELRDRPDTSWEMGTSELNGATAIYTYQFGSHFEKDEQGNPSGAYSNAYALYFNDGQNQIRVVAEYKDAPASREGMLKIAPREDLEKLAHAFMNAYTHAW